MSERGDLDDFLLFAQPVGDDKSCSRHGEFPSAFDASWTAEFWEAAEAAHGDTYAALCRECSTAVSLCDPCDLMLELHSKAG